MTFTWYMQKDNSSETSVFTVTNRKKNKIYHGVYLHISGKNPINQVQFWQEESAL